TTFSFHRSSDLPDLHSFPTRRSSDLIQQQFQCEVKTAEQKKMTYGLAENPSDPEAQQVNEVLFPIARDLLTEVQRSIDFYLSQRSEEHTSELQSLRQLVCRLLLE